MGQPTAAEFSTNSNDMYNSADCSMEVRD